MSFFGFGQSVEVEIVLSDAESRKRAEHKTEDGKKEKYFLFYDGETVSGKVSLALKHPNKRLEHQGIKIEFIGQIGESAPRASLPRRVREPGAHSGEVQRAGAALVMPVGALGPLRSKACPPALAPVALQSSLPKGKARAARGRGATAGVPAAARRGGYLAPECPSVPSTCRSAWLPPSRISE